MTLWKQLSQLYRLPERGWLFGVCAGLAAFYGWRARTLRFVLVAAVLFGGWPFLLAYLVAVFLLPTREEIDDCEDRRPPVSESGGKERADGAYEEPELGRRYARIEQRMRQIEAHLHGEEYRLRTAFRDLETP